MNGYMFTDTFIYMYTYKVVAATVSIGLRLSLCWIPACHKKAARNISGIGFLSLLQASSVCFLFLGTGSASAFFLGFQTRNDAAFVAAGKTAPCLGKSCKHPHQRTLT